MPARLRLSCRVLLIVVLVRPDLYAAVRLTIVLFSSPLTLTEFIWPPGLGPSTGLQVLPGPRFFYQSWFHNWSDGSDIWIDSGSPGSVVVTASVELASVNARTRDAIDHGCPWVGLTHGSGRVEISQFLVGWFRLGPL